MTIDEADTFLKDNEELRGILNSVHQRDMAFVARCNMVTGSPEPAKTRIAAYASKSAELLAR